MSVLIIPKTYQSASVKQVTDRGIPTGESTLDNGAMTKLLALCLLSPAVFATTRVRAEAPVEPKTIYGEDSRREIFEVSDPVASHHALGTAVLMTADKLQPVNSKSSKVLAGIYGSELNLCPSERFYSQKAPGFCSGFLISPTRLATAGHCITNALECSAARAVFGYGFTTPSFDMEEVATSQVYSCERIVARWENPVSGLDFAVIELDRPVQGYPVLPLAEKRAANKGDEVYVIGHPMGLPAKYADGFVRKAVNGSPYFTTNLDTYAGNSGSAVFRKSDGKVVGILVRGATDFVDQGSCKVSRVCRDDLCAGEDVTAIEAVYRYR